MFVSPLLSSSSCLPCHIMPQKVWNFALVNVVINMLPFRRSRLPVSEAKVSNGFISSEKTGGHRMRKENLLNAEYRCAQGLISPS